MMVLGVCPEARHFVRRPPLLPMSSFYSGKSAFFWSKSKFYDLKRVVLFPIQIINLKQAESWLPSLTLLQEHTQAT